MSMASMKAGDTRTQTPSSLRPHDPEPADSVGLLPHQQSLAASKGRRAIHLQVKSRSGCVRPLRPRHCALLALPLRLAAVDKCQWRQVKGPGPGPPIPPQEAI